MNDLLFLSLIVLFFLLTIGLVVTFQRLMR
jgi:succinate-acetate transporter protein